MSLVKYSFSLTELPIKKVERLERANQERPQVDCPVRHFFSPGLYVREMTMPAGTVLTGAVHKTRHMVTITGKCRVVSADGDFDVDGFHAFIAHPGAKRAFYSLSKTILMNYHETTETDIEKLVEELTESTAAQLLGGSENVQLRAEKSQELEA